MFSKEGITIFRGYTHTTHIRSNTYFSLCFQVLLLDNKKSMSVNIFLKQFKQNNKEIVAMIKEGDVSKIGNERLRGLQKILPESDDVSDKFTIFLTFNACYEEEVEFDKICNGSKIDNERLRGLQKILPE